MDDDAKTLIARLIAQGPQPKNDHDSLVMRVLLDQAFRDEVDRRLSACGLCLLDNPYAAQIGLGLKRDVESAIFARDDHWLSNTIGLQRSEIALLMIIWALLILPKRERQQQREDDGQVELLPSSKPISHDRTESVSRQMLIEDFPQLGAPTYIKQRLSVLRRHRFIETDKELVREGPLLDLAFDYNRIAQRIMEGALGDYRVLLKRNADRLDSDRSEPGTGAGGDV